MTTQVAGKWFDTGEYSKDSNGILTNCIVDNSVESVEGYENTVAVVYGRTREEMQERSALIATALDMREELERIVEDLTAGCAHCWGDEHPASSDDCSFCCSRQAVETLIARARGK